MGERSGCIQPMICWKLQWIQRRTKRESCLAKFCEICVRKAYWFKGENLCSVSNWPKNLDSLLDVHHFDSAKAGFVMSCTSFVATFFNAFRRPDATDVTLKYVDAESEGSAVRWGQGWTSLTCSYTPLRDRASFSYLWHLSRGRMLNQV